MDYVTLSARTAADAMHRGVLTSAPATSLREAALLMARFRVHALVVCDDEQEPGTRGALAVVLLADVVAAIDRGDLDRTSAGDGAATPLVTVHVDEPLRRVARLMQRDRASSAERSTSSARRSPSGGWRSTRNRRTARSTSAAPHPWKPRSARSRRRGKTRRAVQRAPRGPALLFFLPSS